MTNDEKFEFATSLDREGKYKEALKIYHELLEVGFHPGGMNGMIGGLLFYELNDPQSALPYCLESVRICPRSELASITLFHVLNEGGRADKAIAEMKRFLSLRDSEEYRQLIKETGIIYDPDDPQE